MTNQPQKITTEQIQASEITVASIETGHLAIGIINIETGKQGVRHLYSEAYEKKWPRAEYPEYYQEDVPVD